VITTAMSAAIAASRERVWRAITDPAEMIRWDEQMLALLEPVEGYPEVGQRVRWRYRLGTVPVVYRDRPTEVVQGERLRSRVDLGLFRFQQTWSLISESGGGGSERTRLGLHLSADNSIPVVGGAVDRFGVRQMAVELVDGRLRALQKWCENHV
jgi:uncharacterized protein YndB with AHSA1/START domain